MKVRACKIAINEIPTKVKPYCGQTFITVGNQYEVHAVAVLDNGITFIQFVDDLGYPAWKPALLFEVVDATLSEDWMCNPISKADGESIFLLGPSFIVKNEEAYNAMVELDAEQVDRFWKRIDLAEGSGRSRHDV